jgi:GNAT superfamily N-acetyltransferase
VRFHEYVNATIRAREPADLDACLRILGAVHAVQRYPIHWPDDAAAWLSPPGTTGAWVALLHREIVGHVCVTSQPNDQRPLSLERLFVSPASSGHGVGKALVEHACRWATQRQERLTLEVVNNCATAIAMYERLGWREKERVEIDWGNGEAQWLIRFDAP